MIDITPPKMPQTVKIDRLVEGYNVRKDYILNYIPFYIKMNKKELKHEVVINLSDFLDDIGIYDKIRADSDAKIKNSDICWNTKVFDILKNEAAGKFYDEKWYRPSSIASMLTQTSVMYKITHNAVFEILNQTWGGSLRYRDIEEFSCKCAEFEELEENSIVDDLYYYDKYMKIFGIKKWTVSHILTKSKKYKEQDKKVKIAKSIVREYYTSHGIDDSLTDNDILVVELPRRLNSMKTVLTTVRNDYRYFEVCPANFSTENFYMNVYKKSDRLYANINGGFE